MSKLMQALQHGEEGHAQSAVGGVIGAVGAILLAVGAANDSGVLAIIGGIVLAVALVAMLAIHHMAVEYDIYGRLEKLEK